MEPASDWRPCTIKYSDGKFKSASFCTCGEYNGPRPCKDQVDLKTNNMSEGEFIKKIKKAFKLIRKIDSDSLPDNRFIQDVMNELHLRIQLGGNYS